MKFFDLLLKLRKNINSIDKNIVLLLSKRQLLSEKVAKIKINHGKTIRDKKREKDILRNLVNFGKIYNIDKHFILSLFELIIQESIKLQESLLRKNIYFDKISNNIVSYLGPKGSYSYIASKLYFEKQNKSTIYHSSSSFKKIIFNVENNKSKYGILPIYNVCSGPIFQTYELLITSSINIIGEINVPINHCLLSKLGTSIETIEVVYSHEEALKQCSYFLSMYSSWKIEFTKSTSAAMKKVSISQSSKVAAIGNEIGSNLYKLYTLKDSISNKKFNKTRFVIFSKKKFVDLNNSFYKMTIVFAIEKNINVLNKINFLFRTKKFRIIRIITKKNILTTVQKTYFMDITNNFKKKDMKCILYKFIKMTSFFKILGFY